MQRPSNSNTGPTTPPKKKLRFAAKQIEYEHPESSDSEDEDVLSTPTGKSFNPDIRNGASPPEGTICALPLDSPICLGGRRRELKPLSVCASGEGLIIHPALDTGASYIWDIATDPADLKFLPIEGDDPVARTEASKIPILCLVIKHEGIYQWPIVVEMAKNSVYPTVRDAFNAIYTNSQKMAAKTDVDKLHDETRRRVYKAREERCREFNLDLKTEPLRRVDFLLGSRRFLGLAQSPGGETYSIRVGSLPTRA